ncbi:hypothetical protein FRB95_010392 [Tulasnella sp. JGI-2019a]|nr:hypothetical protein FRB95_010392 [Tulasnella sp. JGI-2019a]
MRFSHLITPPITLGFVANIGAVPVDMNIQRRDCLLGSCLQSRQNGGNGGNSGNGGSSTSGGANGANGRNRGGGRP